MSFLGSMCISPKYMSLTSGGVIRLLISRTALSAVVTVLSSSALSTVQTPIQPVHIPIEKIHMLQRVARVWQRKQPLVGVASICPDTSGIRACDDQQLIATFARVAYPHRAACQL